MGGDKLVSICCLCYNHSKFLQNLIESIINQEYKNVEIIVLDDGSSDDSLKILYELKNKSSLPMNIIGQKNTGNIAFNLNKLISESSGQYISFIAGDDALLPDAISKKVKIMDRDESVLFVINSQIQAINSDNEPIDYIPMPLDKIENPSVDDIINLDFNDIHSYYIQGSVYRKSLIDAVGGFDEDMICDDLILRTKTARYLKQNPQYTFINLHEPACLYRRHENNISNNYLRQFVAITLFFEKYYFNAPKPELLNTVLKNAVQNTPFQTFMAIIKDKRLKPHLFKALCMFISITINNIFSVKNSTDRSHKIITVLGIKIQLKRK